MKLHNPTRPLCIVQLPPFESSLAPALNNSKATFLVVYPLLLSLKLTAFYGRHFYCIPNMIVISYITGGKSLMKKVINYRQLLYKSPKKGNILHLFKKKHLLHRKPFELEWYLVVLLL